MKKKMEITYFPILKPQGEQSSPILFKMIIEIINNDRNLKYK